MMRNRESTHTIDTVTKTYTLMQDLRVDHLMRMQDLIPTNMMMMHCPHDADDKFGKLNFTIPKFTGNADADAYLSWVIKVDKIFRMHNYSKDKKVAMASLEFEGYANIWWEQVMSEREENLRESIATWEEMKLEMHTRFVQDHYTRDLFNKLQKLTQGTKSVEEYFKEMELTMMRLKLEEKEEQTMAHFFNGLNFPIKRIVEFLPCGTLYTKRLEPSANSKKMPSMSAPRVSSPPVTLRQAHHRHPSHHLHLRPRLSPNHHNQQLKLTHLLQQTPLKHHRHHPK
jgi:hypothetical protein